MNKFAKTFTTIAALCVATAPSLSLADMNIAANVTLTEDTDWRDQGSVNIASGATIDLNGPLCASLQSPAREASLIRRAMNSSTTLRRAAHSAL